MKINYINTKLLRGQVDGLGPLEKDIYQQNLTKLKQGKEITLINIICPGYKKQREIGVEEFDFIELSDQILECPNVILMILKMKNFLKIINKLGFRDNVRTIVILADVAILNYEELSKKQEIKKTMDKFFVSIQKSKLIGRDNIDLVKMSDLPEEFKQIPIDGYKVEKAHLRFARVEKDIKDRANEYIGSLLFDRVNKLMSEGKYKRDNKEKISKQATKEVARFVCEYGLAGLAIKKIYENPIVLFTEPSGHMRGYFYNSYLKPKDRLPVLFLC